MPVYPMKERAMAKKRGAATGSLPVEFLGSANQLFLAGLGAFAKAQKDGTEIFDTLVKEGAKVFTGLVEGAETVRGRAVGVADNTMAEVKAAAAGTWSKLEGILEERVAAVLQRLNLAAKKDVGTPRRRRARSGGQAKTPRAPRRKSAAKSAAGRGARKSRVRKPR